MSATDQAPLVRNQHGVILGVDWRRVPGMAREGVVVPGAVPAWSVMPGDRIRHGRDLVTVLIARPSVLVGVVHLTVRTNEGAEMVLERHRDDRLDVVEVGAFDVR
jgi:hypothetical protein